MVLVILLLVEAQPNYQNECDSFYGIHSKCETMLTQLFSVNYCTDSHKICTCKIEIVAILVVTKFLISRERPKDCCASVEPRRPISNFSCMLKL